MIVLNNTQSRYLRKLAKEAQFRQEKAFADAKRLQDEKLKEAADNKDKPSSKADK